MIARRACDGHCRRMLRCVQDVPNGLRRRCQRVWRSVKPLSDHRYVRSPRVTSEALMIALSAIPTFGIFCIALDLPTPALIAGHGQARTFCGWALDSHLNARVGLTVDHASSPCLCGLRRRPGTQLMILGGRCRDVFSAKLESVEESGDGNARRGGFVRLFRDHFRQPPKLEPNAGQKAC